MSEKTELEYKDSMEHDIHSCSCDGCKLSRVYNDAMHTVAAQRAERTPLLCSPVCFDILGRTGCQEHLSAFPVPFLPHIFVIAYGPEARPNVFAQLPKDMDSHTMLGYIAAAKAFYNELHDLRAKSRAAETPEESLAHFQRMDA